MGYKAVRTGEQLIHWVKGRGRRALRPQARSYELRNLHDEPARAPERDALRRELARLVAEALGL
jgi:hypothetical protein